jgi:hypothetical protein
LSHKLVRHGGRAASEVMTMSAETKEWLVGVVLVLLAVIALVCARPDSVDSND